jgi:hypothetical protein
MCPFTKNTANRFATFAVSYYHKFVEMEWTKEASLDEN